MTVPPQTQIPVGVVVERRKSDNPWTDVIWRPVSVLVGEPAAPPWTQLSETDEVATFYAGAAEIALYRTETANYRANLTMETPSLWVALRPTESEAPFDLAAVTADPAEGESFTEAGNDLIEAVPMPDAVRAIIEAFVAEHFVEQPFSKRQRDRANPEALARHSPTARERDK
ncbi:MAG: DUF3305 domain-containing protein [Xanthobacteraceae bacterium]